MIKKKAASRTRLPISILYGTKINQLLANTAPTGLLFADWLKKKGYSG